MAEKIIILDPFFSVINGVFRANKKNLDEHLPPLLSIKHNDTVTWECREPFWITDIKRATPDRLKELNRILKLNVKANNKDFPFYRQPPPDWEADQAEDDSIYRVNSG